MTRPTLQPGLRRHGLRGALALVATLGSLGLPLALAAPGGAQPARESAPPARDPLQAPVRSAPAVAAAPAGSAAAPAAAAAGAVTSIIARGEERTLVVGSRRYRRGDLLDGARIERIDDSGYWLRQGAALRRIELFPGVRKHALPPEPDAPTRTVSR